MNESIRRNSARTRRFAAAVALLLAASAQGADFSFDIPSGDLKAALDAYVKQTGQQIVYKSDDVKGKTSPGAHGSLSEQQALIALLRGTGLQLRRDDSGAVVVFPAEAVTGGASTQTAGGEQKLEEVIVTGTAVSQIYTTSRTVTRIAADPMLVPLSVSAVQEDLLRYQQASTVTDVLDNVAGASAFTVGRAMTRGFDATVARNGTAASGISNQNVSARPLVALERVEMVKGPEQIMQGVSAGIGGTVNIVTKVPTPGDYAYLGTAVGSDSYWRLDGDVNGVLVDGHYGSLMGQVIGSTSAAGDGPKGTAGPSNDFTSAGLRWTDEKFGTDLSVVYEYAKTVAGVPLMSLSQDERLKDGLPQYLLGDKDSTADRKSNLIDVHLQQRIAGSWEATLSYTWRDEDLDSNTYLADTNPATPAIVYGYQRLEQVSDRSEDLRIGINGQVDTGPLTHKLLLAYDHQTLDEPTAFTTTGVYANDIAAGTQTYTATPGPIINFDSNSSQSGILLTDLLSWENWHALLGVRWLTVDQSTIIGAPYNFKSTSDDSQVLPQFGVVYAINPALSLYASGTDGFAAVNGLRDAGGNELPNTTYTQYETGAKALLLDKQLALTVALYQMKQKDVPQYVGYDPTSGNFIYETVSGLTSKGVDIELAGQPIRGLQVRTTYAYLHVENDQTGQPPTFGYVPNKFTFWSQYWLGRVADHGWWVGGRVSVIDAPKRPAGTGQWSGNSLVDLSAGYQGMQWQVIAGVKNVGNVQGYGTLDGGQLSTNWFWAYRQPGSAYRLDLSYRF